MSSHKSTSAICGICSHLFADPRVLECLHSFCSECLKKILNEHKLHKSLKCPTCKTLTAVSKGEISALPKDLRKSYEAEVAQIASKMESKDNISCDQCVDPSSGPAVSFCVSCSEFLCNACTKHHKMWRKTLDHDVQPIGGSRIGAGVERQLLDNIPRKPLICPQHEDETLKFYCKTCGTLICRDCMAIEHASHKYDRIEKVAEREKMQLVLLLKDADSAKLKLSGAITMGGKVIKKIQSKQTAIEDDIKSAFKALNKALLDREKSLMRVAAEISLGKQTALAIQGEELTALQTEIANTCEIVTSATEVYTPAEMLSMKVAMTNKLKRLLKQYHGVNLEPCRSDMIPSVLDIAELAKHISSFGVAVGGSFLGKAKTDLLIQRAIIGKVKKIVLTACDASGEQFPCGGEKVEATLSLLGSEYHHDDQFNDIFLNPIIKANVNDNRDGTYAITFTPQINGEHQLSITIDGEHISSSPFSMYVRENRAYTTISLPQQSFSLLNGGIPKDVAVGDEIYVAVNGLHCVEVYNLNGLFTRRIGNISGSVHGLGLFGVDPTRGLSPSTGLLFGCPSTEQHAQEIRNTAGMPLTGRIHSGINLSQFLSSTTEVRFNSPSAIAVRGSVLYVVESGTSCVQKLTTAGSSLSKFGSYGAGEGQLNNPRGICIDNEGHVFVSDCGNHRVSVFGADGTFHHHITGNALNNSAINSPWGLAFDQHGNLHVADTDTSSILVFTRQGQFVSKYNSGVTQPAGIAINEEGNIFVADSGYSRMCKMQPARRKNMFPIAQSKEVCILNSQLAYDTKHYFGTGRSASGIAIDKDGFVYVCNMNNKVYKF